MRSRSCCCIGGYLMKMRLFIVFALAACLSLSACSERNVNVSDNSSASNESTPVTETANEPSEEADSNNPDTPEDENSLGIGASNSSSTEDNSVETPTSSSSSEDGYSKRNFGTFSLWLPDNYVIEENVIYEDGTELARKIAEITSIDAISNTASPFEIYDQTYSNAEAVSEFSFGGCPAKSYHLQTEVSDGGMTGFQNEIVYCIETDKNIIVITFYPAMGVGISEQRKEFEKILNSVSVNESADTNSSYKQLSISLPCIGDENLTKVATLVCPTNWTLGGGSTIDINGKKGLEIHCFSPESESMKNTLEQFKTAETKEFDDKYFWIVAEEYNILEKPNWVPYTIWRYYCYDGDLYYGIYFFQNQEEPQMSLEEFESILATMKISNI